MLLRLCVWLALAGTVALAVPTPYECTATSNVTCLTEVNFCCCEADVCLCCLTSQTCASGPACSGVITATPTITPSASVTATQTPTPSTTSSLSPTPSTTSSLSPTRTPTPTTTRSATPTPSCQADQTNSGGLAVVGCGQLAGGTVDAPLVVNAPVVVTGELIVPPNSSVTFVRPNATVDVDGSLVLNSTVTVMPPPSTASGTEFDLFTADNITLGSEFAVVIDYTPERACERARGDRNSDTTSLSVVLTIDATQCTEPSSSSSSTISMLAWIVPVCTIVVCCVCTCCIIAVMAVMLYFGHCAWVKHPIDLGASDSDERVVNSAHRKSRW